MIEDLKYPQSVAERAKICLFQKREEWKLAAAASKLVDWSFKNDRKEFDFLLKLERELWGKVYEQ